jgi:surface antigen
MLRKDSVARRFGMIAVWALAAALVGAPAYADDDDDDDDDKRKRRGPYTEVKDDGRTYEYRYRDRHCKYRYRYDYRSGRAEVDQKGSCAHIAQPVRVVAQPVPVVVVQPPPRAVPPAPQRTVARCDRERVGRILGAVGGGLIGSQIGKDQGNRALGTVGGIVIGVVVGGAIGRSMDESDRACVGQALEWGHAGQPVQWSSQGATYAVVPGAAYERNGQSCRDYTTRSQRGGQADAERGTACRDAQGVWRTT